MKRMDLVMLWYCD